MNRVKFFLAPHDLLILSTVLGLIATIAAPWVELRGTFAAWRIIEWHTFWRGDAAFMLADVVAANYRVPIEYATITMQTTLRAITIIGSIIAIWHSIAFIALIVRLRYPRTPRAWIEITAIIGASAIALILSALIFALPSSVSTKVDFRSTSDIHTDTLVWSNLEILLVAPVFAVLAIVGQLVAVRRFKTGLLS